MFKEILCTLAKHLVSKLVALILKLEGVPENEPGQPDREEVLQNPRYRKAYYILSCGRLNKTADTFIQGRSTKEAIDLLRYCIYAVLKDACARPEAVFLRGHSQASIEKYSDMPELFAALPAASKVEFLPAFYSNGKGGTQHTVSDTVQTVELKDVLLYAAPGNLDKLRDNVLAFQEERFTPDRDHVCRYIPEWNLCLVIDGVHSALGGKYSGEGSINGWVCSIQPLLDHVNTNGAMWFDAHSGKALSQVYDFRIAGAFLLEKKIQEIQNSAKSNSAQ